MPFTVEHTTLQDRSYIQLKNDDAFKVTIIPSVGAMLHAMEVKLKGNDFNVIDNYTPEEISNGSVGNSFKGVKLSLAMQDTRGNIDLGKMISN